MIGLRLFCSVTGFIFLLLFLLIPAALPQVQNGQITGVIADPSGAVLMDAIAYISNPSTGFAAEAETNSSGVYAATELPVGTYLVRVEIPGFKSVTAKNLECSIPMQWVLSRCKRRTFNLTTGNRS